MNPVIRQILSTAFPKYALYWGAFNALCRYDNSYLHLTGWMRSLREGKPVDKDGQEIPWMNYPVIRFLEARLNKDLTLFEFGSGYSTIFYASRVKSVTSVENDEQWLERMRDRVPNNVTLIYRPRDIDGAYCRSVKSTGQRYGVIIVDGRDRVNCIKQSIDVLTEDGVMLLDDSERSTYREGIDFAEARGFRALDFEGLKPTEPDIGRATVFYRSLNCLGI